MSLLCWWKLDGNLNDSSGNENHLKKHGSQVVISEDGKIRCSYETSVVSSTSYLKSSKKIKINKDCSMMCWIKVKDFTIDGANSIFTNHEYADGIEKSYGMGITLLPDGQDRAKVSCNTSYVEGGRTFKDFLSDESFEIFKWTHIGFTYIGDTKEIKFYINGKLSGVRKIPDDKTMAFKEDFIGVFKWATNFDGGRHTTNCKLNDIRIYDNVLSAKLVKEISQAKALHLKCSVDETNYENLIDTSVGSLGVPFENKEVVWGKFTVTRTQLRSILTPFGKRDIQAAFSIMDNTVVENGGMTQMIMYCEDVKPLQEYNVSFYIKAHDGLKYYTPNFIYCVFYDASGNETYKTGYFKNENKILAGNGWYRIFASITTPANSVKVRVYNYCYNLKSSYYMYTGAQITKGRELRDFTQSKYNYAKALYSDCSGLSNHFIHYSLNKPTWSKDAPNGLFGSYHFDGYHKIQSSSIKFPKDSGTLCAWVKLDKYHSSDNGTVITKDRSFYMVVTSFGKLAGYCYGKKNAGYHYSNDLIPLNVWTHLAVTYNESSIKLYINGNLDREILTEGNLESFDDPITIGAEKSNRALNGYVTDARAYYTELSLEDIKEICNVTSSVTNKGEVIFDSFEENYQIGTNLITNGCLEYQDAINVAERVYDKTVNKFKSVGSDYVSFGQYIPIDKEAQYDVSLMVNSANDLRTYFYYALVCLDENKSHIHHEYVHRYGNTDTVITQQINKGDTVVHLESAANWQTESQGSTSYKKYIGVFDRPDAPNRQRASHVAQFIKVEGNTITLASAWVGHVIPAGTKVSNTFSGSTHVYAASGALDDTVLFRNRVYSGWGTDTGCQFRYGTKFIYPMMMCNYGETKDKEMNYSNLSIVNISDSQMAPTDLSLVKPSVKKGKLTCGELSELDASNMITKEIYGATWARIFYHHCKAGAVLFHKDRKEEWLNCNTDNKQSYLYMLEKFRDNKEHFEFLLEYEDLPNQYNRWKQSSNFTTDQTVAGYKPVHIDWSTESWGGLEYNKEIVASGPTSFADGSINQYRWFYAIGATGHYLSGMPMGSGSTPNSVSLWVRCDNLDKIKINKDKTISAKEFIEI